MCIDIEFWFVKFLARWILHDFSYAETRNRSIPLHTIGMRPFEKN